GCAGGGCVGTMRMSLAMSRLAVVAAGLLFAIGFFATSALEASTLGTSLTGACPGGSACVDVTAAPYGNGTGELYTTDATYSTKDGAIECRRQGGTTFGTCAHRYAINGGQTLTIHVRYAAAAGSEICVGVAPLVVACGGAGDTSSYSFSGSGTFSLDDRGFRLLDPASLTVARSGTGSGAVTSDPVGIDCGTKC